MIGGATFAIAKANRRPRLSRTFRWVVTVTVSLVANRVIRQEAGAIAVRVSLDAPGVHAAQGPHHRDRAERGG